MMVKILKRSNSISVLLSYATIFAMRVSAGDYLYNHPNDEDMAAFYKCMVEESKGITIRTPSRDRAFVAHGNKSVRFDVTQLPQLIACLKMAEDGNWPGARSAARRIRALEEISPLEALGLAGQE